MKSVNDLVAHARELITEIPIEQADRTLLEADVVLDVREPQEYASGHIKGAINIPRGTLEFRLGEIPNINSPKSKIVMYCLSGARCSLAALSLLQLGYDNVCSLEGGIQAWIDAGKPVVTSQN